MKGSHSNRFCDYCGHSTASAQATVWRLKVSQPLKAGLLSSIIVRGFKPSVTVSRRSATDWLDLL